MLFLQVSQESMHSDCTSLLSRNAAGAKESLVLGGAERDEAHDDQWLQSLGLDVLLHPHDDVAHLAGPGRWARCQVALHVVLESTCT